MPESAIYHPEQWTNFFVLVGTGSAALTGLVFVAISVNLRDVVKDATHTYRAINMLTGFGAVFIISCFALMGQQTDRTLGAGWLVISLVATAINTNGYVRGLSLAGSHYALGVFRVAGGSACYLAQVIGSAMLLLGTGAGIYVAAAGVVANFFFLISGSWLLIVGTLQSAHVAVRPASSAGRVIRDRD